jgi:hypothetical protein
MATLTIPITIEQICELARQLSPQERQALLDSLLAERFDATLTESDRLRAREADVSDEELQAEVHAVRGERQEGRQRAAGG